MRTITFKDGSKIEIQGEKYTRVNSKGSRWLINPGDALDIMERNEWESDVYTASIIVNK